MLRTFLKKNKKGFTLTELMIVVVIIGILTAIAIPIYNSVTKKAANAANDDNIRTIESALTQYCADTEILLSNINVDGDGKLTLEDGGTPPKQLVGVDNFLKEWPTPPKQFPSGSSYTVSKGVVSGPATLS